MYMRVNERTFITNVLVLCFVVVAILLSSCKNSIDADEIEETSSSSIVISSSDESSSSRVSSSSLEESSSSSTPPYPESFKPDDKEYPYAGIPRIVIETENRQAIVDRETEIPAKMQIWGDSTAESEIMDLTIRGRGNSSWDVMPKKSYKIEFENKQLMLGMPKDKDWALIANYADKTLMRNYISYQLSAALGAYYAPHCEFAELYLNQEYLGVYLLTETIKVGENRVNIPNDDNSYIVEVDGKYRDNEQVVFSDVIMGDGMGVPFRVHSPKNAALNVLDTVQKHVEKFEFFLQNVETDNIDVMDSWIDVGESIKHYWVQEFTKNPDADFYTSVYFSWVRGESIKMGPVWDFDMAFGNHPNEKINLRTQWHIRPKYWNKYLFKNEEYKNKANLYWNEKRRYFVAVLDSIDACRKKLEKAVMNDLKKWNPNGLYDDSVDNLKIWIFERLNWIDAEIAKE